MGATLEPTFHLAVAILLLPSYRCPATTSSPYRRHITVVILPLHISSCGIILLAFWPEVATRDRHPPNPSRSSAIGSLTVFALGSLTLFALSLNQMADMAHIAIGEAEGFAWLESVIGPGARIGSAEELVPEAEGEEASDTAWLESLIDDDEQLAPAEQRGLLELIDERIEPEARRRVRTRYSKGGCSLVTSIPVHGVSNTEDLHAEGFRGPKL